MRYRASLASLALIPFAAAACAPTNVVPPPAPPQASYPSEITVPEVSAESGLARVVISTDVPARVERLEHIIVSYRSGTSRVLLCDPTPCAVTLPYGDHELVFTAKADAERTSSATIHAREQTVVVNHALGQLHHSSGEGTGVALLLTGLLIVGIAGGVAAAENKNGGMSTDAKQVVGVLALAGLGSLAVGGIVLAASPTTIQEGATRQWNVPAKAASASLGLKF
jgi:hypothetical protein